ncbi:hypothetical protein V6N13_144688 [Hibiscus sabdariffa]
MGSRWMAMLSYLVLWFLMLRGGEWCEGCFEEERLALFRLKPFFPFIDYTFERPEGLDYFYYPGVEDYDPVEEKESSIDCCIKMLSKLNNLETLNLSRNNLGNNIFSQLHDFTSLKSLNLRDCGLGGTINLLEFNTLMNLKELYLDRNGIEGIESSFREKGELRLNKLEVLGLAQNQFTNTIFTSLAALPNLKSLDLGFNKLKGAIDVKDLNALNNLEELILWDNEVTKLAPSPELRLMNLKLLDLSDNPLDHSILATLGRLSNLKTLYFEVTQLNESIDITEIDGLKNLEDLGMYCYSELDGLSSLNLEELDIRCYSREWQILTNLEMLVLSDSSFPSNFIGTLPSLKQLFMYHCYFNDNLFMQDTVNLKNLEILQVYGTSLGNNFIKRIGGMPSLKILDLQSCGLNDTLHSQGFCGLTNLRNLYMSHNNLKGERLPSLSYLNMARNHFHGSIPTSIGDMNSLQDLDLSDNQLSGGLPEHLSMGCSSLLSLTLSNNSLQEFKKLNSTSFILNIGSITTAITKTKKQSPQYLSNFSFKGLVKLLINGSLHFEACVNSN